MQSTLYLSVRNFVLPTHWNWVLTNARKEILGQHNVALDASTQKYRVSVDLAAFYLQNQSSKGFDDLVAHDSQEQPNCLPVTDLGIWIGEEVFGDLRTELRNYCNRALTAVVVQVILEERAQGLLLFPFELARFSDGTSFRKAGVQFVYSLASNSTPEEDKEPAVRDLRILAVFSLPVLVSPLNLRRERFELQRLIRDLKLRKSLHLRVLQYGATRKALEDTLEEREGWDIIHFSGHGQCGDLLLEDDRGGNDTIHTAELDKLLKPARARLKLLILNICYSGGNGPAISSPVVQDRASERRRTAYGDAKGEPTKTVLPNLAQELAKQLDCAVLAMRYPVDDAFATELVLSLYEKLLDRRRPLPEALHLALDTALPTRIPWPTVSEYSYNLECTREATPILVGGACR